MPRPPLQGEVWSISGIRGKHLEHGDQVEVSNCVLQRPSGRLVTKVLAESRAFPGIGTITARKLWNEYGEKIYDLLDDGRPSAFAGLIGEELANVLILGWQEMSVEADVYRWLDARGVPPFLASKLIAIYGREAIAKLEDNPYRLLAFTSWTQADCLGRASGIAPDDPRRLAAAADAAVYSRLQLQHTWTPSDLFVTLLGGQLSWMPMLLSPQSMKVRCWIFPPPIVCCVGFNLDVGYCCSVDPAQLPPIGFGLVFHAVVRESAIPQVELTEIMRQGLD